MSFPLWKILRSLPPQASMVAGGGWFQWGPGEQWDAVAGHEKMIRMILPNIILIYYWLEWSKRTTKTDLDTERPVSQNWLGMMNVIPLSCFEMGPSTSNQTIDQVCFEWIPATMSQSLWPQEVIWVQYGTVWLTKLIIPTLHPYFHIIPIFWSNLGTHKGLLKWRYPQGFTQV